MRMCIYFMTFVLLLLTQLALGSKYIGEPVFVDNNSYIFLVIYSVYSFILTIYEVNKIRHIHKLKVENGYLYDKQDFDFTKDKVIFGVVFIGFFVGAAGSIAGIAGSLILNPIFLFLGLIPTVIAATN